MTEERYVGCDPSIYDAGGFYDHPRILEQIRADGRDAAPDLRVVATLHPATVARRPFHRDRLFAPDGLVDELAHRHALTGGEHAALPASVLVRLDGARILDRAIYLDREDGPRPLYETHRHCDRGSLTWTDAAAPATDLPDTHDYLLLSSAGTFNWGHWLIDDLTRLTAVAASARPGRRLSLLLHGFVPEVDRVRRDMLRTLVGRRPSVTVRLLRPDTVYRAPTLFFASPVSTHPAPKHPAALADLARRGEAALARRWWRPSRRPTRLLVARRVEHGRVPEGWEALHARLVGQGFVPFDPEGASARAQIAAFAAAERVVGCMGAAMANTVFCRPGTRVLHLAPDTFPEPFYADLAAARGHAYAACYGAAVDAEKGAAARFRLDPEHLEPALDWLCAP